MAEGSLTAAEIEVLIGKRSIAPRASGTQPPETRERCDELAGLLAPINERAARQFAGELASLLRRTVQVRTRGIETISAAALQMLVKDAPYHRRVEVSPSTHPWSIVFSPNSLYPLIDCLLGGNGKASMDVRRRPTEIEARLADRVVERMLVCLKVAWSPVASLEFSVCAAVNQTSQAPDRGSSDSCAWCVFSLELAGLQGELALAVPADLLMELPVAKATERTSAKDANPEIEIAACLAECTIAADDVAELSLGDIIATDHRADRPINLTRDGQTVFQARLGAWQGRKALEIEQIVSEPNHDAGEETGGGAD